MTNRELKENLQILEILFYKFPATVQSVCFISPSQPLETLRSTFH